MPVTIHTPCPQLSEYISYYYCVDEISPDVTELRKKIPDGTVELFFHYGNPFYKISRYGQAELISNRSLLLGQMHDFIKFRSIEHIGFIGVKFKPNGFQPFSGDTVCLYTDQIIDIKDLWGSEVESLEDALCTAESTENRVAILDDFLLKNLAGTSDKLIDHCTGLIYENNGNMSVGDLAAKVNLSIRQLERKFLDVVGITPHCFSRISRIQKTLSKIEANDYENLTQLSYENGFYDQSHMIREMNRFAGVTPKSIRLIRDCYGKTSFM